MAEDLVTDAMVAQNQAQASKLWHMRESDFGSGKNAKALPSSTTSRCRWLRSPPLSRKPPPPVLKKFPGARPVCFGHMGDGNLHFNFNAPPGEDAAFAAEWDEMQLTVHDIVKDYSGSISAEHGIGQMKRDLLPRYKSSEELDAMRALKAAFDPKNILNPGKTVPPCRRL